MTENKDKNKGKKLNGVVTSTAMDKTAVVKVDSYKKHPKYGKFVKSSKKYKVHDPENTLVMGQKVEIRESRPISKDKRFVIAA